MLSKLFNESLPCWGYAGIRSRDRQVQFPQLVANSCVGSDLGTLITDANNRHEILMTDTSIVQYTPNPHIISICFRVSCRPGFPVSLLLADVCVHRVLIHSIWFLCSFLVCLVVCLSVCVSIPLCVSFWSLASTASRLLLGMPLHDYFPSSAIGCVRAAAPHVFVAVGGFLTMLGAAG
jgi:hypothetical protein